MRYVLFVCTHNAGRSQIAQAFFERYAPTDLRAESAGQEPASSASGRTGRLLWQGGSRRRAHRASRSCHSYDALGDRTTVTTPAPASQSGHETTTNTYDPGGRLTIASAPAASNDAGAPNQVTNYSYDDADELTTITKGFGTTAASQPV